MKLNRLMLFGTSARLLLFLLVAFVAWQVWFFSRPLPRNYTERERQAIEAALREGLKPVQVRIGEKPTRFGIAHFLRDSNDEVTTTIKRLVSEHETWSLIDTSPIQKFLADISRNVLQATSLDEVVNAGRRVEIDVIVAGEVVRVDDTDQGATAAIRLNIYDARDGQWLTAGLYEKTVAAPLGARVSTSVRTIPRLLRLALWLGIVGGLPWLTAFATHGVLEKKNNLASFALITIYAIIGVALSLFLNPGPVAGTIAWLRLLIAFITASTYSYWACEKIAERG